MNPPLFDLLVPVGSDLFVCYAALVFPGDAASVARPERDYKTLPGPVFTEAIRPDQP